MLIQSTIPGVEQLTVIFAGPQGSGKDTQVALLKNYLLHHYTTPVVHFDAGTELRTFAHEGGFTQDHVAASLTRGELQPMFVLAHVMGRFFINWLKGEEHLLISGFPRSEDQLMLFQSAMSFYERKQPILIFLSVPEEVSVARLLKRERSDDTEESIRKRLRWTKEQTLPVIHTFQKNPAYRYIEIDGTTSIEDVHAAVLKQLELI